MKQFRQILVIMAILSLITASTSSYAAENNLREVFQDAFYGAGIGALVGGAFMAFTKKPADHLDYIGYGAAAGVLVGAAYGLAKSARALAEIDNGKLKFAVPTIVPGVIDLHPPVRPLLCGCQYPEGTFN